MEFQSWYDKNYKKLLIAPIILLSLSIIYLILFSVQTGDLIYRDVSLTGGTTISITTDISQLDLENYLSENFTDFSIKTVSDNAGNQLQIVITITEENSKELEASLEEFLEYKLTNENSSKEMTSSALSGDFYKQLIVAVLLAFFWMAGIVFLIFAKGKKVKMWTILLNLVLGFFMGLFFLTINPILATIIFLLITIPLIYIYFKNSIPSFAVMLSAFADIVMTLAIVNLVGMKLSTAGIVAFLMLIGYSVDTDILLTTRLLKKKGRVNSALFGAFKTGTTMTITSIIAITTALIVVYPFASVLNQIFTILLIGLGLDLFNTWITNASLIKWYVEEKL